MKKYIVSSLLGLVLVFGLAVPQAKAVTEEETIKQLLSIIATLTAQINTLIAQRTATGANNTSSNTTISATPSFNYGQTISTLNAGCNYGMDIKYTNKGEEVTRLQTWLKNNGYSYYITDVTGYYGVQTKAAIEAFQKSKGITEEGVGPKTRALLNALTKCNPVPVSSSVTSDPNSPAQSSSLKLDYIQPIGTGLSKNELSSSISARLYGVFDQSVSDYKVYFEKNGVKVSVKGELSFSNAITLKVPNLDSGEYNLFVENNGKVSNILKVMVNSTSASINVLSPVAGQTFKKDTAIPVNWVSKNIPSGNVDIQLFEGERLITTYSDTPNDGKESVKFNSGLLLPERYYRVEVKYPVGNERTYTAGSQYFTITDYTTSSASIKVLSPNGGEMWQEGKTYNIKWDFMAKGDSNPTGSIALTKDGNIVRVIKSIRLNEESFSWTIPPEFVTEASPGKYEIKVFSSDVGVSDSSDSQFTIYASAGTPPTTPSLPLNSPLEKYKVTLPNGNSVYFYESFNGKAAPQVMSLSKTSTVTGDTVTIVGKNLKTDTENIIIIDNLKGGQYEVVAKAVGMTSDTQSVNFKVDNWVTGQYYVYVLNDDGQSNYRGMYVTKK